MVGNRTLKDLRIAVRGSMNLSFAGCGFLGIYHVGVCSCFRRYASQLSADKISGASAGALAACALITGVGLGEATNYVLDIALKARSRALGPLHPSFNICQHVREGLERFLPDNAYEICDGRLHVSLTRVSDRQNVLVSKFESNEDLIQALICSSFVPFYSGVIPPKYKGVRYVDGGLSDNIPILDDLTITISPFAGESDICPDDGSSSYLHVHLANTSIQVNTGNLYRVSHALFPSGPEHLSAMCQQGFDDALKFLQKNDLINCARHLRIESAITPVTSRHTEVDEATYIDSMKAPYLELDSDEDFCSESSRMDLSFEEAEDQGEEDYEEDEEEEGTDYLDSCEDCQKHRHTALTQSLPHPVVSALQAGIDSVNRGVLAPVYNLQAFKVMSLLAAPWILPVDVCLVLARKFVDWAPYLPSDMQWFVQEFGIIVKELYDMIQTSRHRYSARFTCQLAITETGYTDKARRPSSPLFKRPRRKSGASLQRNLNNLNMGFSVDFHTHQKSPLLCMDELRQQMRRSSVSAADEQSQPLPSTSRTTSFKLNPSTQPDNSVVYDTFDNCLHITKQMDALLAYYYTEENDPNTIKVAEIFALDDPRGPRPDFNSSDLSWDNYVEMENETSSSFRRSKTEICLPISDLGFTTEEEEDGV